VNTSLLLAAAMAGYAAGQLVGGVHRTRLAVALAAAQRRASTDALTGLANRAGLAAELARRAGRGEASAVLLLDLDGFKPVNDRHGHEAGDAVLVEVGRRLAGLTPAGGFAARLGGDEFVLIVPLRAGQRLAEDVHRAVTRPVLVGGQWVSVGASIGIAHAAPGSEASEVLHRADVAMYRAKTTRTAVEVADEATVAGAGRPVARLRDMPPLAEPVDAGRPA
jgi:diguanylate cyclase (GGDEF)-like protein